MYFPYFLYGLNKWCWTSISSGFYFSVLTSGGGGQFFFFFIVGILLYLYLINLEKNKMVRKASNPFFFKIKKVNLVFFFLILIFGLHILMSSIFVISYWLGFFYLFVGVKFLLFLFKVDVSKFLKHDIFSYWMHQLERSFWQCKELKLWSNKDEFNFFSFKMFNFYWKKYILFYIVCVIYLLLSSILLIYRLFLYGYRFLSSFSTHVSNKDLFFDHFSLRLVNPWSLVFVQLKSIISKKKLFDSVCVRNTFSNKYKYPSNLVLQSFEHNHFSDNFMPLMSKVQFWTYQHMLPKYLFLFSFYAKSSWRSKYLFLNKKMLYHNYDNHLLSSNSFKVDQKDSFYCKLFDNSVRDNNKVFDLISSKNLKKIFFHQKINKSTQFRLNKRSSFFLNMSKSKRNKIRINSFFDKSDSIFSFKKQILRIWIFYLSDKIFKSSMLKQSSFIFSYNQINFFDLWIFKLQRAMVLDYDSYCINQNQFDHNKYKNGLFENVFFSNYWTDLEYNGLSYLRRFDNQLYQKYFIGKIWLNVSFFFIRLVSLFLYFFSSNWILYFQWYLSRVSFRK